MQGGIWRWEFPFETPFRRGALVKGSRRRGGRNLYTCKQRSISQFWTQYFSVNAFYASTSYSTGEVPHLRSFNTEFANSHIYLADYFHTTAFRKHIDLIWDDHGSLELRMPSRVCPHYEMIFYTTGRTQYLSGVLQACALLVTSGDMVWIMAFHLLRRMCGCQSLSSRSPV